MMNTKETRKLVRDYCAARGQNYNGLTWTNAAADSSKRNLAFNLTYGVKLDESDCRYLRWMTQCKDVTLTTSERGHNYLRMTGVQFN